MNLKFKRLNDDAILPTRAHLGDAGLDLYVTEDVTVQTGVVTIAPTGLAVEIPFGYVGLVHPRSGLAFKHGITVVNAPGTIDAAFRGEIKVALTTVEYAAMYTHRPSDPSVIRIEKGDRIAQLVIQKVELPVPIWVNELSDTDRGAGGFGSTGK